MGFRGPFRRKKQANQGRPPVDHPDVVEPSAVFDAGEGPRAEPNPKSGQPKFRHRHPRLFWPLVIGAAILVGPAACRALWHVGDPVTYGGTPANPNQVLPNGQSPSPEKEDALNELKAIAKISCTGANTVEAFSGINSKRTTNPLLMDALKEDKTSYSNYKSMNTTALDAISAIQGENYSQPDCQLGVGAPDIIDKYGQFVSNQLPEIKSSSQKISDILKAHPELIRSGQKDKITGQIESLPSQASAVKARVDKLYNLRAR